MPGTWTLSRREQGTTGDLVVPTEHRGLGGASGKGPLANVGDGRDTSYI